MIFVPLQPCSYLFVIAALFLIRGDSFLDTIENTSIRKVFVDELQPIANRKLKMLKQKIEERFPVS